jgi:hypothetical protein
MGKKPAYLYYYIRMRAAAARLFQPSAGGESEPCISAVPGYHEVILRLARLSIPNFVCP